MRIALLLSTVVSISACRSAEPEANEPGLLHRPYQDWTRSLIAAPSC